MPKLLKIYLLVTGIPALLALMAPGLVPIGIFFIVPGLILLLAPTAFLWGCMYAAAFWFVRRFAGIKASVISAFPIVALALWLIPQPSLRSAQTALGRHQLPDVALKAPIRPAGDIRLDTRRPRLDRKNRRGDGDRGYGCDNRCLALLFEPGVRSVTVNSSADLTFEQLRDGASVLSSRARTFRLKPRGACGDSVYEPNLSMMLGHFGTNLDDKCATAADWKRRLGTENCIVLGPAMARYDLLLRTGEWWPDAGGKPGRPGWSLFSSRTSAEFAEARTGSGGPLLRVYELQTSALSVPLMIGGKGGIENFRFGWERKLLSERSAAGRKEPDRQLDAALDVRRAPDRQRTLSATRDALSAAVADPSLPPGQPVFSSVPEYLQLLKGIGAAPEDLDLIERLIRESRLDDLDGAWLLPEILSAGDLGALRPAIARKLHSLPATVDPSTHHLGNVLKKWPDGAFATLTAEEERLIEDTDRRRRANGLIVRLSDRGAPAAPVLAQIVEDHVRALSGFDRKDPGLPPIEKRHGYSAHRATIEAAVKGLCRLGPAARAQLGRLLELESREPVHSGVRREWDRMMVRLGKPVEDVRKPERMSGTEERYQRDLRGFLREPFDPERRC
jgi:hypothetical protein